MPTGATNDYNWRLHEFMPQKMVTIDIVRPRPAIEGGDLSRYTDLTADLTIVDAKEDEGPLREQGSYVRYVFTITKQPIPADVTEADQVVCASEEYNVTKVLLNRTRTTPVLSLETRKARPS